mgnify:CR=1 FL=1
MSNFIKPDEIKIGTQYIPIGMKNKKVHTVVDILKTYNTKNELVHIRYVSEHDYIGQKIINSDVVAVTIQRGFLK